MVPSYANWGSLDSTWSTLPSHSITISSMQILVGKPRSWGGGGGGVTYGGSPDETLNYVIIVVFQVVVFQMVM